MKPLNLDTLDTPPAPIEKGGQVYAVRAITARIASLLDAAGEADGAAKLSAYCDAVAALVPTMPRAEVDDCTVPQLLAIVMHASGSVQAVESAVTDPNATGSAPTSSTPAAPSDTPVPAAT